jgi:hypothetical protein
MAMPQCYTLTRKGQNEPEFRTKIDEELCKLLGLPVHPEYWVRDWDNVIGFALACGKTMDQVREMLLQYREKAIKKNNEDGANYYRDLLKIQEYLDQNFTVNAWYQVGE